MDWQESRVDWAEDDPTFRLSFPTLAAYIYVNHWLAVLIAEKMPLVWNRMMKGPLKKRRMKKKTHPGYNDGAWDSMES